MDLTIEENGVLCPIAIKKSAKATADETAAFTVLDQGSGKKRGDGVPTIC